MKITLTASFERDFKKLVDKGREQVCDVVLKLPTAIGRPHLHAGIGIRKIHPSGIFEARLGLGLRLIFAVEKKGIILHRLGDHEAIRHYLKTL